MSGSIASTSGVGPNSTITKSIWIQARTRCKQNRELIGQEESCNGSSTPPANAPPPPSKFTPVELKADGNHQTCVDAMRKFMEVIDIVGETHFRRFRIEAGCREPDDFQQVFREIMDLVGSSVTFLRLCWYETTQISLDDLRSLIFERSPLLHTLCIQPQLSEYDDDEDYWITITKKTGQPLFKRIPNLRRIKVVTSCALGEATRHLITKVVRRATTLEYIAIKFEPIEVQGSINFILSTLREPPEASLRVSKLKTLKISVQNFKELVNLIQLNKCQGLRLETLSMSVLCLTTKTLRARRELTTLFCEFLVTQRPTIRKLSLDFIPLRTGLEIRKNYGASFRVPCMDKLRTFKLGLIPSAETHIELEFEGQRGRGRGGKAIGITKETLATTFPNLERLIHRQCQHDHEREHKYDAPLLQLQNVSELNGSTEKSSAAPSSGEDPQTETTDDELDPFVFNECKQRLRPVRKALKAFDNPDRTLTEKEQVRTTRASLQTIGDHIEECCSEYKVKKQDLAAKTWRTNLWTFVSKFTEDDHVKLHRLYKRARKSLHYQIK